MDVVVAVATLFPTKHVTKQAQASFGNSSCYGVRWLQFSNEKEKQQQQRFFKHATDLAKRKLLR